MQRADPQRRAQARDQTIGVALKSERREWRCREAGSVDRPRSAADRAGAPRSASPAPRSPPHRRRTWRPAPRPAAPARPRARRRPKSVSTTGNSLASSSAERKRRPSCGRYDEDRALLGHLTNSDQARILKRRDPSLAALMRRQRSPSRGSQVVLDRSRNASTINGLSPSSASASRARALSWARPASRWPLRRSGNAVNSAPWPSRRAHSCRSCARKR